MWPGVDNFWIRNYSHIHPNSRLYGDIEIGRFCIVEKDCEIGDGSRLGDYCKLMPGSVLGTRVRMDDYANTSGPVVLGDGVMVKRQACCTQGLIAYDHAFIGPGVMVIHEQHVSWARPGVRRVSRGVMLGVGAVVGGQALLMPGVEVGDNAWVASGAVVTHDCDAGGIYVGAPARKVGEVPEEYLITEPARGVLRFSEEVLAEYLPDLVSVGKVEVR